MLQFLISWWHTRQLGRLINTGQWDQARTYLKQRQRSGNRLSIWERFVLQYFVLESQLTSVNKINEKNSHKNHTIPIKKSQKITEKPRDFDYWKSDPCLIDYVEKTLKLHKIDVGAAKITGIDEKVFNAFEKSIVELLREQFSKYSASDDLKKDLAVAMEDLLSLKKGKEPTYNLRLSFHVYALTYLLENVYCSYVAWFLLYKIGKFPRNLSILDLGAGPGTMAFGLSLFKNTASAVINNFTPTVNYYSVDKQRSLQSYGLQFWYRWQSTQISRVNLYSHIETIDFVDGVDRLDFIPKKNFDLITICHAFSYDEFDQRVIWGSFRHTIDHALKDEGMVIFICQNRKFINQINQSNGEKSDQEVKTFTKAPKEEAWLINALLDSLNLHLVFYQSVSSTNPREPMTKQEFGHFAKNLPPQTWMNTLNRDFFSQSYPKNYALDDYIIFAQKGRKLIRS